MRRLGPRALPLAALAGVVLATSALSWFAATRLPRPDAPDDYNLAAWEVRHVAGKWIYKARHLFGGPSASQQQEDVARFFDLLAEIDRLERTVAEPDTDPAAREAAEARLQAARRERDGLRPAVESSLEGRMTAVIEDLGLERKPPFLPGPRLVWPPVDVAFDVPPRVLAVSPRDRIELVERRLLRAGMTVEEREALEDQYRRRNLSALVAGVAGVGTYPAMVPADRGYNETLELMAHEWTHNYLAFRPLGIRYFESADLSTINETVADLVGRELGGLVAERFPLPAPPAPSPTPAPSFDATATLRETRREVERLLADGKVEEAESLMEDRRRFLADHGYYIRKLNQAYFAFYGQYADTGASIDPLGAKVEEIRRRSRDLGEFLRRVSAVTSRDGLDRLLDTLRAERPE